MSCSSTLEEAMPKANMEADTYPLVMTVRELLVRTEAIPIAEENPFVE